MELTRPRINTRVAQFLSRSARYSPKDLDEVWGRSALKMFARMEWSHQRSALGFSGHGQAQLPRDGRQACEPSYTLLGKTKDHVRGTHQIENKLLGISFAKP